MALLLLYSYSSKSTRIYQKIFGFPFDYWTSINLGVLLLRWPACIERKPCGPPPLWPVNSALRAENETDEIRVPDSAIFNCRDEGQVTNIGPTVELKCIIRPGEENATFEYPSVWGTQGGKCRAPVKCREPFEAPLETGLELVEQEEPYLEFGYAEYR